MFAFLNVFCFSSVVTVAWYLTDIFRSILSIVQLYMCWQSSFRKSSQIYSETIETHQYVLKQFVITNHSGTAAGPCMRLRLTASQTY